MSRIATATASGIAICALLAGSTLAQLVDLGNQARLIPVSPQLAAGYATNEINATSITRSSLLTYGNEQFAAYYDGKSYHIVVARRTHGSATWQLFDTGLMPNDVTDCHDALSMGIDGNGFMHISWGMHAEPLKYAKSIGRVTGSAEISFGETFATLPGQTTNLQSFVKVTYPEFYKIPNSDDLLVFYRSGHSGSGSEFASRFDAATGQWKSVTPNGKSLISGHIVPGVNGDVDVNPYLNNLVFDAAGNMHMTWNWRTGSDSKSGTKGLSNHNLLYAMSPAGPMLAKVWFRQNGRRYKSEITQAESNSDPSGGQVIKYIPEGANLINNSCMALDRDGHPMVATWWAPKHTADPQTSVETIQYMLVYYDGQQWQTWQITNRPPGPKNQEEPSVHAIGQPIVVVDRENRVIVVMRYDRAHRGDGGLQVAFSTDRTNWEFLELTTEPLGDFEPTYDWHLWNRENKLAILYQPVGIVWDGSHSRVRETAPVAVLEWDVGRYFAEAAALSAIRSRDN